MVRATLEHSLLYDGGKRLYYMGPMFRHERPQRGRYRQFNQVGAECFGDAGPGSDAEMIDALVGFLEAIGIPQPDVFLNSIGSGDTRETKARAGKAPGIQEAIADGSQKIIHRSASVRMSRRWGAPAGIQAASWGGTSQTPSSVRTCTMPEAAKVSWAGQWMCSSDLD